MSSPEEPQPKLDDPVLGTQQSPPIPAPVLGGLDSLPQRFPHLPLAAQQASLLTLVDCGEAGLQQIIHCLQSPNLDLRCMAYELLQIMPETIAQQVIEPGFPLYPGEVIYQVYESAIAYNDCWYDLLTTLEDCTIDHPTILLGQYIDRPSAETAVKKFHHDRAVQDLTSGYPHFFDTAIDPQSNAAFWQFPLLDWCETHGIPLRLPQESQADYAIRFAQLAPELAMLPAVNQFFFQECHHQEEPDSDESDLHRDLGQRMVTFLIAAQKHDLMAQIWRETIGPLAFIHEQPVRQITYCDRHPSGSIIVLKN